MQSAVVALGNSLYYSSLVSTRLELFLSQLLTLLSDPSPFLRANVARIHMLMNRDSSTCVYIMSILCTRTCTYIPRMLIPVLFCSTAVHDGQKCTSIYDSELLSGLCFKLCRNSRKSRASLGLLLFESLGSPNERRTLQIRDSARVRVVLSSLT